MTDVSERTADLVQLSQADRIATITLNRPGAYNALSEDMVEALTTVIASLSHNPDLRVIVVTQAGPGFCGGHDLKEIHAHRTDTDGGRAYYERLVSACSGLMQAIVASPKILVAQVGGIATAAGCQLVAACDLAIASTAARFGVNGINAGLFCSTPMVALSRNIGRKMALELLTTGRLMSADEAIQAGLINRAVPGNALGKTVQDMAGAIAEKPANVLALGKRAFYRQLEMPLSEAYAYTSKVITDNIMLDEAVEGISAFVDKRPPDWD